MFLHVYCRCMYSPGIPDLCVSPILQQQQQQQHQADAVAAFAVIAPLLSSLLGSLADAYPKGRKVQEVRAEEEGVQM